MSDREARPGWRWPFPGRELLRKHLPQPVVEWLAATDKQLGGTFDRFETVHQQQSPETAALAARLADIEATVNGLQNALLQGQPFLSPPIPEQPAPNEAADIGALRQEVRALAAGGIAPLVPMPSKGGVTGPNSSTDNAVARWDGSTGRKLQNSGVVVDDTNNVTGVVNFTATGAVSGASATFTGALVVDTSTLVVDAANNRVGIGTATPGVPMDFRDPTGSSVTMEFRSGSPSSVDGIAVLRMGAHNATGNSVAQTTTTAGRDAAGNTSAAYLAFATRNAAGTIVERMRMNSTGQTGINIAAPISTLHVYEDTTSVGTATGLTIEQDGTGDVQVQLLLTGAFRWVIGADNSDSDTLKIGRGAAWITGVDFSIDTSGVVGITTLRMSGLFRTNSYTVAGLPTGAAGDLAYASNGRKTGEGGGAGTGIPVYHDGVAWRRFYDDATATA